MSLTKLNWWMENLRVFNGKCLILPKAQVVIETDLSLRPSGGGGSGHCMGVEKGVKWSPSVKTLRINSLESKNVNNVNSEEFNPNFHKKQTVGLHLHANGQHSSFVISADSRRHEKQEFDKNDQRNLDLFNQQSDYKYCGIPS